LFWVVENFILLALKQFYVGRTVNLIFDVSQLRCHILVLSGVMFIV